ncbi:MAG: hypothetical protein WC676_08185 [Candidatus Omnitrophota bacterium]
MKESPLFWPVQFKGSYFLVLDETLIPKKLHYVKVDSVKAAVDVIRQMKTRAFGQFLVVLSTFLVVLKKSEKKDSGQLFEALQKAAQALNASRPTFPFSEVTGMVLHWANQALQEKKDLVSFLEKNINGFLSGIRARRLERVNRIAELMKEGSRVLTHCNVSGELAMAASICQEQKKQISFFATETRPFLQGAKLTCWELQRIGADVTLIADNAIGTLFGNHLIDMVIVGSDRSCANGDFANKIGTYQIAVLAKEFNVPFYALTQPSNKIPKGDDIPIEIRDEKELLEFNRKRIAPKAVKGFYPGFDVVTRDFIKEAIAINVN